MQYWRDKMRSIKPESLWQNAYIESFYDKLRDDGSTARCSVAMRRLRS